MSVVDVPGGRLVTIGTVVAENIARSLDLPESAVEAIEQAMTDEIAALSAHFAFTIEDLRKQWEKAEDKLTRIKAVLTGEPTPEMGSIELTEIPVNG
jgi:hypothetical protein